MCAELGLRVTQTGILRYSAMTLLPASSVHSKPFLNAVSDILRFTKRIRGSSVLLHSTGPGIHRDIHPGWDFRLTQAGEAHPGWSRLHVHLGESRLALTTTWNGPSNISRSRLDLHMQSPVPHCL